MISAIHNILPSWKTTLAVGLGGFLLAIETYRKCETVFNAIHPPQSQQNTEHVLIQYKTKVTSATKDHFFIHFGVCLSPAGLAAICGIYRAIYPARIPVTYPLLTTHVVIALLATGAYCPTNINSIIHIANRAKTELIPSKELDDLHDSTIKQLAELTFPIPYAINKVAAAINSIVNFRG